MIPFLLSPSENKIQKSDKIISIGSCFAQTMGERLLAEGYEMINQPFGTIFHPLAIRKLFSDSAVLEEELMLRDGFWAHPDFHSKFKNTEKSQVITDILHVRKEVKAAIKVSQWLILTFGTSFRYFDLNLGRPIANCHKQPQQRFRKDLIRLELMEAELLVFFKELKEENPSLRILLTVSPVRHTRDGIMENMVSKSNLRVLADRLVTQCSFVDYFPAYEIMYDELRDYEYYQPDAIHPNPIAEDYIWEKFRQVYLKN